MGTTIAFILKIFQFVIKNWKVILIILFIVALFLLWNLWGRLKDQKAETQRWETNYTERTMELQKTYDKYNREVAQVQLLTFTVDELAAANYSKDSLLRRIAFELESQKIAAKQVESALLAQIETLGKGTGTRTDTVFMYGADSLFGYLIEIDDGYLDLDLYEYEGQDTVDYNYRYSEEIFIASYLEYGKNKKGKDRFFLWRWLNPKWDPTTTVKGLNPNSSISAAVEIEIVNKRKRKQ